LTYSPDQLFRVAKNISITKVEDESVVLDLNSGSYYGLNHVGTLLLEELQRKHSLGQAVKEISRRYQTSPVLVTNDTSKLVGQLLEQKILFPID